MYENKVIVMGRLTRKPELKDYTNGGGSFVILNIAVNNTWNDKETGEKKESVEFISVSVFGKPASNCAEYLDKGQLVYTEGRIKNRVEEAQDGTKKYHTGIIADRVQFGAKAGPKTEDDQYSSERTTRTPETRPAPRNDSLKPIEYPNDEINAADIPF